MNRELSLNAFNLVVFQSIDFTFEKYLDDESSYGFTAFINLLNEDRNTDGPYYNESVSATAFYRLYFGDKPNSGFFAEGFSTLSRGVNDFYYDYDYIPCVECDYAYNPIIRKYSALSLGLSIGSKWQVKKSLTYSIILGIGRNINADNAPAAIPRIGMSFGKKF